MSDGWKLDYLEARTVVRIEGTVTIDTDASGERVAERASEIAVAVEADHEGGACSLEIDPRWWKDQETELTLADDGRLSGTSHSAKGLGAQVVGAAANAVALAGKVATGFLGFAPAAARTAVPIEDDLASDPTQGDLAARRKEYRAAIDALQKTLLQTANAAAADPAPAAKERVATLKAALDAARAEAAVLEAAFEEWRAERYPTWTQTLTYVIGTDKIPRRSGADPELTLSEDEAIGDVGAAARTLGLVVVRLDEEDNHHTADDTAADAIHYRLPKRVELAVYEAEDAEVPAGETKVPERFLLKSLIPAWVVDADSVHRSIPLSSGFFTERKTTLEFGAAGTLTKISGKSVGSGAQIATLLGGAGGNITGGLDSAAKIAAAFPAPADPSLKALQDQVTRKELEAKLATAKHTIASKGNGTVKPD